MKCPDDFNQPYKEIAPLMAEFVVQKKGLKWRTWTHKKLANSAEKKQRIALSMNK